MKLEELDKLDIKPIEVHVSGLIGANVKFDKEIGLNRHDKKYMELESNEMIDYVGIFKGALKSVKVGTFNPISLSEDEKFFWCSISIWYRTKSDGENGVGLCGCVFEIEKGKWSFR